MKNAHRTAHRIGSVFATAALFMVACTRLPSPSVSLTASSDPRSRLKAGVFDAEEYTSNLRVLAKMRSPTGFLGEANSDLAFTGNYVVQGNFNGPVIWDISKPQSPTLVVAYECPASQNDVSVYRNLMFLSAEALNGRVDCKPGGVRETVSKDRMRGVRIFDISDIRQPRLVANVQTCRGSHTHTVLEDPNDPFNIYIYVAGSAEVRSSSEVPECSKAPSTEGSSNLLRIEIIKVPLADPGKAAVVNRAKIFDGLSAPTFHGPSAADRAMLEALRKRGAFAAFIPAFGLVEELPSDMVKPIIDTIVKQRGGTVATASDSSAARPIVENMLKVLMHQDGLMPDPSGRLNDMRQCHDITTYSTIGLAAGACEGHGLLLDISNPVSPVRLDAVADSNFAYWHSATFNNEGTAVLFSDEWGGGVAPKCRSGDKPEWGANAIFDIVTDSLTRKKRLRFRSYYKLPAHQTEFENCVAHNGSLIPVPGRDIMVQSWYQGGISVFDWTDTERPFEIASFDRGPVDSSRLEVGGSWSAYWYNGLIISSEITRGLDVVELVPSQHLSQNEIDAAKTVQWSELNAQGQHRASWPPTFSLVKAYTDQLARRRCAERTVTALRAQIAAAERARGGARREALAAAMKLAEGGRSCDERKTTLLLSALGDLRTQSR